MKLRDIFTPKVLSGLAVVGVVGTAVLAAMEGMASKEKIQKIKDEMPEEKKESKLAVSSYYVPRVAGCFWKTIVVGGVTIACVVTSCYLSGLQLAAMAGTVSYLVSQRTVIEKEVSKIPGGKEALEKAKKEVAKMTVDKKAEEDEHKSLLPIPWRGQSIESTGNGDDIFVDEWSGRVFYSSLEAVKKACDDINERREEGLDLPFSNNVEVNFPLAMPYNDILIAFGLEPSGMGHQFGYPASDDWYEHRAIPFEITKVEYGDLTPTQQRRYGKGIYVISIPDGFYPMESWQEL